MTEIRPYRWLFLLAGAGLFSGAAPVLAQAPQTPDARPHLSRPTPEMPTEILLDRLFARLHKAQNAEAAKVLEQAIWNVWAQSGSPSADALLGQASRAMAANRYAVALGILDTVIDIRPQFAEAWNKRATLFFLERDFDRSLADIDMVLKLEPRHFGALSGLGLIRRQLGDKRGALEAFRRALAIHPYMPGAIKAVEELEPELEQKI